MKFIWFSLVMNLRNPVTGEQFGTTEKFENIIKQAQLAEELGFDGYGIGERHGDPFLSSSPPVLLTAIAARTSRIRLLTAVTVLSVLDPIRVAEDYATLDHLSGGRLELIIGKGNDPRHYPLFGITEEEQWDSMEERYELLRRLWREENVSWQGRYRPPLDGVTTQPRPLQQPIPIWHGSASSTRSTELAARYGEPIFSSNSFHPQAKYKELIEHYRERLAYYGHDPSKAVVGAGAGSLYIANTTEEAIGRYRPYYDAHQATAAAQHNKSPFTSLEDVIERGPSLVGSAEQIIEKILNYQQAFGHQVLSLSVDGLTEAEQREQMQRFAEDIAPVLRREVPSTVWRDTKTRLSVETV
ncbi:alkanesulfonate monooxygenase SsuD/methylene tetrahydromethanopterin reductase-like flavin-dependent oxidoreductase (luciferase family) [Paenibacillus cellulosilyticus]|uniref:Alkanesulfonate monooxygenase SsuD/methylene tetrahydromethanopterin reductase-like flavin-dependent oxidoreductase (Luciferase family) n=1 Tax=Paenibacillus cellulosilyticus TaxID=375489 RepID=A0A2V2YRV7_9BACL|nr:LLM class flavin-dependent oxidoreductase [Paenibacillus cellulosilyticus]PWV97322.1 alkanesulfonate monooxygenase SsuD/methylene tetrahydromethanopterin reductase-like flavin-dependent oxidoreductase (luciferase family) [Paenibacillus cellulosilyticus]QKS47478.1 LLM class flavin-dependent oxidoreductase [Paenibacillus cellulosilyticus]